MMASKPPHSHPPTMPNVATAPDSKLLRKGLFDARDELECTLHDSYISLQSRLTLSYQACSTDADADLLQLNQALIYGILTQPQSQQSFVTRLAAVTRDGYACFVSILVRLVNESYLKLLDQPRRHLLWLVQQLISLSASEVDTLCLSLLRRIASGDISQWNVWLAGRMLDLLRSNWSWFVGNSALLTNGLFTFLRLLPDHFMAKSPVLNELKQDEAAFCVKILRECFQDCLVIGRDLIRLLQDVARIPEFESVWRDLLSNASAFNTVGFADIAQLYVVRTPSRYLASRLTPEMEAQIRFMLTHVRMGNQQRYQAWFAQRFLTAPGSETLICDLIRFICCAHHPSNQVLQSDIVPRWAVLGWLLTCCKSHHVEANAKLALFFDWLFYMHKTDNIMNIEPALLLMMYSIPKYLDMTHSLLEFLFLCMEHYDPHRKDLIMCGVTAAVDILVEKGVVQSLKPLSSSPHVTPLLKKRLIEYFPIYCQAEREAHNGPKQEALQEGTSVIGPAPALDVQTLASKKIDAPGNAEAKHVADECVAGDHDKASMLELAGKVSIDDVVLHNKERSDVVALDELFKAVKGSHDEAVEVFEKVLQSCLSENEKAAAEKGGILPKAGGSFKEMSEHDAETVELSAKRISGALKKSGYNFFAPLRGHLPGSLEIDEIVSVTSAVFRMYIHSSHPQLLQMLLSWHTEGFAVGARFLCYACRLAEVFSPSYNSLDTNAKVEADILSHAIDKKSPDVPPFKRRKTLKMSALSWHQDSQDNENGKMGRRQQALEMAGPAQTKPQPAVTKSFKAYEEFLKGIKNKGGHISRALPSAQSKTVDGMQGKEMMNQQGDDGLDMVFIQDLETCLTWNSHKLLSILSLVFDYLPELARGKERVLKLLLSIVDPVELSKYELKLTLKELSVFRLQPICITNIIRSSLSWDCFEQQYLWRLLISELQNSMPLLVSNLVESCALYMEPAKHSEAVSGLLLLLRMQCPTLHLMSAMLCLPKDFDKLVASVFAAWVSMDTSRFSGCLTALAIDSRLQAKKEPTKNLTYNDSSLLIFSSFLDNWLDKANEVDEKEKMEIERLRHIVIELADNFSSKTTANMQSNSAK